MRVERASPVRRRVAVGAGVLLTVGAGVLLAAAVLDRSSGGRTMRPNVLLVTYCTMRADALPPYSGRAGAAPNIDRLAAGGTVFEAHYTQATYSGGAFATIMTGRYPFHTGAYDHPMRLPDDETTLAEMFRQNGYATGAFISHPHASGKFNFDQGFEVFDEGQETRATEERIDAVIRWLSVKRARPVFTWLQSQVTHFPYRRLPRDAVPPDVRTRFDDLRLRAPNRRLQFEMETVGAAEDELAAARMMYAHAVAYTDQLLGRVLAALDENDLSASTIVIVTADHGEALGEHGIHFNHDANLYETTARVPLIIRIPGRAPGRISATTRQIDLVPTALALAGMEPPPSVDGQSLLPLLEGRPLHLPAFMESRQYTPGRRGLKRYPLSIPGIGGKLRALRRGPYKIIVTPAPAGVRHELYDLASDPEERNDLASAEPALAETLATELQAWFSHYEHIAERSLVLDEKDLRSLEALGYLH